MSSSRVRVPVDLLTPQGPLELSLYDHNHRLVSQGFGCIRRKLRPGLYRLEINGGSRVAERFFSVGDDGLIDHDVRLEMPSVAPVLGMSTTPDFHAEPVSHLSANPSRFYGQGGRLVLFVRSMEGDQRSPVDVTSLELVGATGETLATGSEDFESPPRDGWAAISADLTPGGYALRHRRPSRRSGEVESVDQSLWIEEGWVTLVFVPSRESVDRLEPEFASIHMMKLERAPFDPYDETMLGAHVALEMALSGLRQGRALVPSELAELLTKTEYRNPMLGIVGALALLFDHDTNWSQFHGVRRHLRELLPNHPDVQALHVAAKKRDDGTESRIPAVYWPPMLHGGYQALIHRDSVERSRIIPRSSVADLAAARTLAQGPWTRWRTLPAESVEEESSHIGVRVQKALDRVGSAADDEATEKILATVRATLERTVSELASSAEASPTRRRPAPRYPAETRQIDEDAPALEDVRFAAYLEDLTTQAVRYGREVPATFEIGPLSRRLGLPQASVRRAVVRMAKKGIPS